MHHCMTDGTSYPTLSSQNSITTATIESSIVAVVIKVAPSNVGYLVTSTTCDALVGLYGSSNVYDLDAVVSK